METKELLWNHIDHICAPKYSSMYVERMQTLLKRANSILVGWRDGTIGTTEEVQDHITIWQAECRNAGVEL